MKLEEIAPRINEHLKRFEADPVINAPEPSLQESPSLLPSGSRKNRAIRGGELRLISAHFPSNQGRG